jgi:NhaP-type Na+/H+ and K+/H+ antiporter
MTPGYIGYGQVPAPAGSQWAGWAPPVLSTAGTNGMAIAGFVLGLLGFMGITAILGIVFGSVALSRIRRTAQEGKGLAIAGIVLGSCWLAFFVILFVIGAVVGATSGPSTSG